MKTSDLLRKVRRIEIKSKGLSSNIFAGEYHSAFKGRGMAFSEVRGYQIGDDVRDIDWNVTARYAQPYIKVFEEERELTVMLMVDVSSSFDFGTETMTKRELVTEISATLAFSALENNDKIGLILFSDRIEKFIPPQKGRKHILHIIRELVEFEPQGKSTDLNVPLRFMMNVSKKKSTAFLLSDFLGQDTFRESMLPVSKRHDLIGIRLYDRRERSMPNIGLVQVFDPERSQYLWIDTSSAKSRRSYETKMQVQAQAVRDVFTLSGVDFIEIATSDDYVRSLMTLFQQRR